MARHSRRHAGWVTGLTPGWISGRNAGWFTGLTPGWIRERDCLRRPIYHKFGDEEAVGVEAGRGVEALDEHAFLFAQTDDHTHKWCADAFHE